MIRLTGFRLLASLPIVALVTLTMGMCFGVAVVPPIFAGWIAIALAMPWLTACKLVSGEGIDLSLGRWYATVAHVLALTVQGALTLILVINAGLVTEGTLTSGCALLMAGAIGGSLLITVGQLALLRQAYRRWVDMVGMGG